ncbi:MAG TPA: hypothetical protein VM054_07055 [bacterium]|nr:hypothetical protein [bacterium]
MYEVYKVGSRHFIVVDYCDGLYYAPLPLRAQRKFGTSHVSGSLDYVAGLTRRFYTRREAEAARLAEWWAKNKDTVAQLISTSEEAVKRMDAAEEIVNEMLRLTDSSGETTTPYPHGDADAGAKESK